MRADAQANRRALLDAARTLYAARGTAVAFSAVAQEAGVGIGTLYRHFPTQDALVLGVVEDARDLVTGLCDRWLPAMTSDPDHAWAGFVTDVAALQTGALVLQLIQDRDADTLAPQLAEARSDVLAAVGRVVTAAKAAGLVRDEVTTQHFAVGLGALTRPLPPALTLQLADFDAWLVDVYLRGLRPL